MKNLNRWALIVLGLGILIVFGILAFLLFSRPNSAENALPTIVVLNTASPTEIIPTVESSPTPESTATNEIFPSDTPINIDPDPTVTVTNTEAPLSATEAATTASTNNAASATNTSSVAFLPSTNPTNAGIIVISTQAPAETLAPTISPQASSTPAPVTTLDTTGLVAFNQPSDVGVGELRVLSVTVPADEVILSLGGNPPAIAANQQWVLVELFMLCPGTENCAPASSSFSLQSNAHNYQPTALSLESAFGSLMINNQSIGHLAFVIARNESPFALELNIGGQVYRFALQ